MLRMLQSRASVCKHLQRGASCYTQHDLQHGNDYPRPDLISPIFPGC